MGEEESSTDVDVEGGRGLVRGGVADEQGSQPIGQLEGAVYALVLRGLSHALDHATQQRGLRDGRHHCRRSNPAGARQQPVRSQSAASQSQA